MRLKDKVAIVTGSAQGMGRAFVERFAREGAKVTLCDVTPCDPAAEELRAAGAEVLALETDVRSEDSAEMMVRKTVERFGRLDVLVNNAAIFGGIEMKPFEEISTEEWDRIMAVNLRGIFCCCRAVIPQMKKQKEGKIINIASGVAFSGLPYLLHYTTSKGGVVALTRGLAREVGQYNINVNAVAPGMVWTPASQRMVSDELANEIAGKQIIQRIVQPEDVASAVLFFASDDSDLITGQTLLVNGGEVLH